VIARYSLKQAPAFRRQIYMIMAATLIPVVFSMLNAAGFKSPWAVILTPVWILTTAIAYSVMMARFRFPFILPVAYRMLFDNIPDGILIIDSQDRLMKINPAAESLTGISDNRRGRSLRLIWPELFTALTGIKETPRAEMTLLKNQKTHYLEVTQVILPDQQGWPAGKMVIVRDISELKKVQQDLEAEIQKRSQYSRSLVHELRTPLTSIIAGTDLLTNLVKEPTPQRIFQNIQRAAHNLDQRVTELFELARGEVGLIKLKTSPLDLGRLIEEITDEISPLAGNKGLILETDCLPGLRVLGDKDRLRQVMSNLLNNALKFTEQGVIRVRLAPFYGRYCLIQVSDSGKGLLPEQQKNLFDPYRPNTPGSKSEAGLGIGLALSKILVELHQGAIWVESEVGRGSTFSFKLPLLQEEPSEQAR